MTARATVRAGLYAGVLLLGTAGAQAQQHPGTREVPAARGKVAGTISIDYRSRSERSTSGVDVYDIKALTVADLMIMNGTIQRSPGKQLTYSVKYDVINPANPSQIATEAAILRGDLIIDDRGAYTPERGRLRLDVVKGNQSTSTVKGVIQGRPVTRWWELGEIVRRVQKEATKTYSRYIDGRVVSIEVKNPDPLSFERLGLPAGPFGFLPETRVGGNFDFDYELGNWLTDNNGITFNYMVGDRPVTDRVTGSIRFVEEEGTFEGAKAQKQSHTGYYDYTLRFNEAAVDKDKSFFDTGAQAQADAFFSSVDQTKPGIYGRIYYNDREDGCRKVKKAEGKMECVGPTGSEVTYDLKTVGLSYIQVANWMKLELLVIGPFTDE